MPMVAAANITNAAKKGIYDLLRVGVQEVKQKIFHFIRWVKTGPKPDKAQRQFALLKLKFNAFLDQLDIFADVLTQRGEHETGVWIGGLDVLARDAIRLDKSYTSTPPLVTYLDRGHGAAIRRARTRLPGGKSNPVALIRVPRERMVSSGIASSLVHEVGHQGVALLSLIPSVRKALRQKAKTDKANRSVWQLFERWISEILADFWAVSKLGVTATNGLIGVVSLPSYFVFRMNLDDPHPFPWIRVKISCAFGKALFPDAQWGRISQQWNSFYRLDRIRPKDQQLLHKIERVIPAFVHLLIHHKPAALKGKKLVNAFKTGHIRPRHLRKLFNLWQQKPHLIKKANPTLVFATIGQARSDRVLSPKKENELLSEMLSYWARQNAFHN